MLCDDCGKNEAHIHIVQIGPDGRTEKNLCEQCAAHYGDNIFAPRRSDVSFNDFLKGVFGGSAEEREAEPEDQSAASCPNCGMSYHDFRQTGKIGCSVCYDTFRPQLEPLLRRIHGSSTHSGKIPRRSGGALEVKQEIALLRASLQKAVAQEEYEKAAEFRDRIRELEKVLQEREGGVSDGTR